MKLSRLPAHASPGQPLLPGEQDVLRLIVKGRTDVEIGAALGLTENAVDYRVQCILSKLGAVNRTAAAFIAGRDGMVS